MDKFSALVIKAITGGRLGPKSYTLEGAVRDAERRGGSAKSGKPRPWELVGVSRETWRRWHLPEEHKNHQWPPSKANQGKLLGYLRRSRLSAAREAKIRAGNIHFEGKSRSDGTRNFGPQSLNWRAADGAAVVDAFLNGGPKAAVAAFVHHLYQRDTSGFVATHIVPPPLRAAAKSGNPKDMPPDDYDDDDSDLAYEGDADDGDSGDYDYAAVAVSFTSSHTGSTRSGVGGRGRK